MKKVWKLYGIFKDEVVLNSDTYVSHPCSILYEIKEFEHYEDADYYMRDTCLYTGYKEFTIKEVYIL